MEAEEWKTRFSILHYLIGGVLVLQKNDKTISRRHPTGLDWTASPFSRDNVDDDDEEDEGDDDAGVGGPDDDYVIDDGDDDDDQG